MAIKEKISFNGLGMRFIDIPISWKRENEIMLGVAGTASMVRQYLKQFYPDFKFWVKSDSYSMGDNIQVYGWNLPEVNKDDYSESTERVMNRRLSALFQEGSFNGMEDIYEYGDMTKITSDDGIKIDYGTKYMRYSNKPPYESKEAKMPVPNYEGLSIEPKSSSSTQKNSKPVASKKPYSKNTSNKNYEKLQDNPEFIKIANLSTGYDLFYNPNYGENECQIAFAYDWAVAKKGIFGDAWKNLKSSMEDLGFMWNLKEKAFYLTNKGLTLVSNEFAIDSVLQDYHAFYKGDISKNWKSIDAKFIEFGYKKIREPKLFYSITDDNKIIIIDEIDNKPTPEPNPEPTPITKIDEPISFNGPVPLDTATIAWAEGSGNYDGTIYIDWTGLQEGLRRLHTEAGHPNDSYKVGISLRFKDGTEIENIKINTNDKMFDPNENFKIGEYFKSILQSMDEGRKEDYLWTDEPSTKKDDNTTSASNNKGKRGRPRKNQQNPPSDIDLLITDLRVLYDIDPSEELKQQIEDLETLAQLDI